MWRVVKRIEGLHGSDTSTLQKRRFVATLLALTLGRQSVCARPSALPAASQAMPSPFGTFGSSLSGVENSTLHPTERFP